jgi:methoxymalonate biosynthesis acyl carrier protein
MADPTISMIRQFVLAHVSGIDVVDDEDIFAAGYVNSLFAVQLVLWVEQTFGVPMTSEDLQIDNFRTIAAIAAFVDERRSPAAQMASREGERGWTSA